MIKKIIDGDVKISLALVAAFVLLTFQFSLLVILDLMNTPVGIFLQDSFKILIALIYLYAFSIVWKRKSKILIISYIFFILLILIQYMLYPQNTISLNGILLYMLLINIPTFVYLLSVKDITIFMKLTRIASGIIFIIVFILGIFVLIGLAELDTYSMSLSYYTLFPALISLGDLLNKFRIKNFVVFLISISIIIVLGSRGPLICVAIFFLLSLINKSSKTSLKGIFTKTSLLIGITILMINVKYIFEYLFLYLMSKGIYSRTLFMFQESNYSLSGRDHILYIIIDGLTNSPFKGIGIAGDRTLTGTYSHNIFIELLSGLGVFIGGISVVILIFLLIRALLISDQQWYRLLTFWISVGFIHLMISGSYLIEMKFWILLAILIKINFNKTNNTKRLIN